MIEDTGIGGPDIGFEAAIEHANLTPVEVEGLDILIANTCSQGSLFQSHAHGSHRWLRSQTRHALIVSRCEFPSHVKYHSGRLTIYRNVDDIRTSRGACNHTCSSNTRGVMRVHMNGKVGIPFPDCPNKAVKITHCVSSVTPDERKIISQLRSRGFQQTSHILDTEDMNAFFHKLIHEVEVILQSVLGLFGACDITAVADNSFTNTTSFLGSVDTKSHLRCPIHFTTYVSVNNPLTFSVGEQRRVRNITKPWKYMMPTKIIQRVENPENVKAILNSLLGEIVYRIIAKAPSRQLTRSNDLERLFQHTDNSCIQHRWRHERGPEGEYWAPICGVSSKYTMIITTSSLKGHRSGAYQAFPGIFIQEPHGDIEGRSTPTFNTVCIGERVTCLLRNIHHIDRAQASSKQRLMRITPCGVHDQCTRVFTHGLCKGFRALLNNDVSPTNGARQRCIEGGSIDGILATLKFGDDDVDLEAGFTLFFEGSSCENKQVTTSLTV